LQPVKVAATAKTGKMTAAKDSPMEIAPYPFNALIHLVGLDDFGGGHI